MQSIMSPVSIDFLHINRGFEFIFLDPTDELHRLNRPSIGSTVAEQTARGDIPVEDRGKSVQKNANLPILVILRLHGFF